MVDTSFTHPFNAVLLSFVYAGYTNKSVKHLKPTPLEPSRVPRFAAKNDICKDSVSSVYIEYLAGIPDSDSISTGPNVLDLCSIHTYASSNNGARCCSI